MPAPAAAKPVLLPQKGTARVKNVMSGDTVVLWGKAPAPGLPPPQVQFTLEGLMAPRCVLSIRYIMLTAIKSFEFIRRYAQLA